MIYTTALQSDLPEILSLFRAATLHMDEQGVLQWDEIYPDESVLRDDIAQCAMTLGWIDGRIAVVFVLDYCKEGDYESARRYFSESLTPSFSRVSPLSTHPASSSSCAALSGLYSQVVFGEA